MLLAWVQPPRAHGSVSRDEWSQVPARATARGNGPERQRDAPSITSTGSFVASIPATHRRFTATLPFPISSVPREKARTPHVLQNGWWLFFVPNW